MTNIKSLPRSLVLMGVMFGIFLMGCGQKTEEISSSENQTAMTNEIKQQNTQTTTSLQRSEEEMLLLGAP